MLSQRRVTASFVLTAAALSGLFGVGAIEARQKKDPQPTVYEPSPAVAEAMSVEEATRIIKGTLVRFRWWGFPDPFTFVRTEEIEIESYRDDAIWLRARNNKTDSTMRFRIADLQPKLVGDKKSAHDWELRLNALVGGIEGGNGDQAALRALADALLALKRHSSIEFDTTFQRRFDEALRASRPAPAGVDLPEAVRRFRVQAELAFQKNDFPGAAALYEQGLKIGPGWPEGHYNRAEMLASMGRYTEALIAMHRYLALRPNASDARAALDRTYEWESEEELYVEVVSNFLKGKTTTTKMPGKPIRQ